MCIRGGKQTCSCWSKWLDSPFHHRLARPRRHLENLFGNLTWETKWKEAHTHGEKRAGLLRRTSCFKLKRTKGWYVIQGLHIIVDGFHRWLCIQRRARSEWTDENNLKQSDLHNTQHRELKKFLLILRFKMQSKGAHWPKRNSLVKHLLIWG